MAKEKKPELEYVCGWCKHKFKQRVGKYGRVSSQVRCPVCQNFLKTWSGK